MNAYFNYIYNFMGNISSNIMDALGAISKTLGGIFDFTFYIKLFNSYKSGFSTFGWIAVTITHIILLIILILIIYLIYRGIKLLLRFKVPVIEHEKLKDEVVKLNREIMKVSYEKDKILAMQISKMGMDVNRELLATDESAEEIDTETINEIEEVFTGPQEYRFPRLTEVDTIYNSDQYIKPEYDTTFTLEELCKNFRNFAASKLGLYYELSTIKYFFASLGVTKIIILQGISGTGKTSLPYALGQYIQNPAVICSVQPSWRDRAELFGYYNEFTKKYTETDFLKSIYEAQFFEDIRVIILDEMNIARVEYYFAEMLSILEMPREEERIVSIVSSKFASDPEKMKEGKIAIPSNVWYIGTINNDDSTFAVSDKVYDRAIPVDLDDRAEFFEAPETERIHISYAYLSKLYVEAKEKYPISEEMLMELNKLDKYLIKHFRITFGNRILKQLKEFVPYYIACGGTEIDGIDFILVKKILRKFESIGMGFIRDELDGFLKYLDRGFGEDNMKLSKEYINRLKKME